MLGVGVALSPQATRIPLARPDALPSGPSAANMSREVWHAAALAMATADPPSRKLLSERRLGKKNATISRRRSSQFSLP